MEVNDALIDKLARLSRLEFQDIEKEEIKKDMQQMISFIDKLNELDTTGVEPRMHMSNEVNPFREDVVKGSIPTSLALSNAPLHDDHFFIVPKVISKP